MSDDWRRLAVCRGRIDAWFPDPDDRQAAATAKAGCAICPVRVDCLTASVEHDEPAGVWAGAGEDDRRHLRRAWEQGDRQRPLPYRPDDPWSQAAAAHLDHLDIVHLGAVVLEKQTQLAIVQPTPRMIPVDKPDSGSCGRCGAATRRREAIDRNGPGATCGLAVTYARGCDCAPCLEAHLARDRASKADSRPADRTRQLFGAHPA